MEDVASSGYVSMDTLSSTSILDKDDEEAC